MSVGGFPNPWELYASAPYQYPLAELFPVVRIPVAGPDPFNTLVVVRGVLGLTEYRVADGSVGRPTYTFSTTFQLAGHDPRVMPSFLQSTTASIQMIQSSDDSSFIEAVDSISGAFDTSGTWTITASIADAWDDVIATANAYYSSWVLCYEPPIDHGRNPGRPWSLDEQVRTFAHWPIPGARFGITDHQGALPALRHPDPLNGEDAQISE